MDIATNTIGRDRKHHLPWYLTIAVSLLIPSAITFSIVLLSGFIDWIGLLAEIPDKFLPTWVKIIQGIFAFYLFLFAPIIVWSTLPVAGLFCIVSFVLAPTVKLRKWATVALGLVILFLLLQFLSIIFLGMIAEHKNNLGLT